MKYCKFHVVLTDNQPIDFHATSFNFSIFEKT